MTCSVSKKLLQKICQHLTKLFPLRKCEFCGSIFVTWNWFSSLGKIRKVKLVDVDKQFPYGRSVEIIHDLKWNHECWICNNVQHTNHKVRNGIPYKLLCYLFRWSE